MSALSAFSAVIVSAWIGTLHAIDGSVDVLSVMIGFLLVALLALPSWPYSMKWGLIPSSACGFLALMTATLVLLGRL